MFWRKEKSVAPSSSHTPDCPNWQHYPSSQSHFGSPFWCCCKIKANQICNYPSQKKIHLYVSHIVHLGKLIFLQKPTNNNTFTLYLLTQTSILWHNSKLPNVKLMRFYCIFPYVSAHTRLNASHSCRYD